MNHKLIVMGLFLGSMLFLSMVLAPRAFKIEGNDSVYELLKKLGDQESLPKPKPIDKRVTIKAGEGLVLYGATNGKPGLIKGRQSKHFVCTSCHNIVKEDPDLSKVDPQARLLYARDNNLPYLPGTSLYGAVNRTSFYNGDYEKKYGDLVKPARNNIREAIQLCAVECSQGRALKDWELESVMAYLWTLELKVDDLNLTNREKTAIEEAISNGSNQTAAIQTLKGKYLKGAPATFITPPPNRTKGYEDVKKGDPENGKLLYDLSCKFCHESGRYAFFELDDSWFSFRFMEKHLDRYTRYSLYQVARYGTSPLNGKKAYMPLFTEEKMNNQQVEDLKAYIVQQSKPK